MNHANAPTPVADMGIAKLAKNIAVKMVLKQIAVRMVMTKNHGNERVRNIVPCSFQ